MNFPQRLTLIIFAFFLLLTTACTSENSHTPTTPSTLPNPTSTASPTVTPTPVQPTIILLAPEDPYLFSTDNLLSTLESIVSPRGWMLERHHSLGSGVLGPHVELVVVISPYPELENLARSFPDVQFVAINFSDLDEMSNLSVIGPQGEPVDQLAFLAGYIAALVTDDWRVGVISEASQTINNIVQMGFSNGVIFYCGLCRPIRPPYLSYPIYFLLPEGATESEWLSAADWMLSNGVRTVFIFSPDINLAALSMLKDSGISIIGVIDPPEDGSDTWLLTIRTSPETILEDQWDQLLAGTGGLSVPMLFVLDHVNEEILTPGKQLFLVDVMHDLVHGFIDTGVIPIAP
ncbi:MAG: hypothetical protein GTO18_01420 [Anaerolineales bacterium]|nr:hypothetical protein [Anaerolineales bacterium]